jgi:hypothetical protein
MATERANSLKAFRDFADEKLSNGGAEMTLDEALSLWEYENSPEDEREETVKSIRRGLDDMYAGRTRPAEESLRELCRKHGLTDPQ